jgi:hypothetical protein
MKAQTIEIVKQVRLTPKQRITLMDMANAGGVKPRLEHDAQTVLQHLGLIEKRSRFTPTEKAKRAEKIKADWKECRGFTLAKDLRALERKIDQMQSDQRESEDTAWFLTAAAQEYLLQGTVTIKTGPTPKAATDAG